MRYKDWPKDAANTVESLRAELATEREKVREYEQEQTALISDTTSQMRAIADYDNENTSLRQQLAASQLSEQRLREALEVARACLVDGETMQEDWDRIDEVRTSTTTDTAALDTYVAEKVEPWKKDAERLDWFLMRGQVSSNALVELHVRVLNNERPSLTEWREAIDAAIAEQSTKFGSDHGENP